jgi:intermediate cleaving peptidase 55
MAGLARPLKLLKRAGVGGSRALREDFRHQYSSSAQVSDFQQASSSQSSTPLQRSNRRYGQPLPSTHPHLFPHRLPLLGGADIEPFDAHGFPNVAFDELTPGIPASEYEDRRRKLMDRLPEKSVVVVMAGRTKMMSGKIFYRFRQDSNFLYLTGFQEPDSALILEKNSSSKGYKMTMFVPSREDSNETWNGPKTGTDGAINIFGADDAYSMEPSAFLTHLKQALVDANHIYVEPPTSPTIPRQSSRAAKMPSLLNFLSPLSPTAYDLFPKKADFESVVKMLGDTNRSHSLAKELDKMRLIKSGNELRLMRRAGRVGSQAMMEAMRAARPGCTEWQLQSTFESSCGMQGAQRPAYVPVVASGSNALTIHYIQNDSICQKDDLVCMDAGCELDGYVSDITRAFPVQGHFSSPQKDLYQAVLNVLKACTRLISEDQCYTLSELHRRSVELLNVELKQLKFDLKPGSLERDLYPHALSHWLGMDLHDTPSIDRNTKLTSGMCLSVEPAVYCNEAISGIPKHFHGLGIRVEDDVAVYGAKGNILLNAECVREVSDVEATCSGFWDKQPSTFQQQQQQSSTSSSL